MVFAENISKGPGSKGAGSEHPLQRVLKKLPHSNFGAFFVRSAKFLKHHFECQQAKNVHQSRYSYGGIRNWKIEHCVINYHYKWHFKKGGIIIMSVHQCQCGRLWVFIICHCVLIIWCAVMWVKVSQRYFKISQR